MAENITTVFLEQGVEAIQDCRNIEIRKETIRRDESVTEEKRAELLQALEAESEEADLIRALAMDNLFGSSVLTVATVPQTKLAMSISNPHSLIRVKFGIPDDVQTAIRQMLENEPSRKYVFLTVPDVHPQQGLFVPGQLTRSVRGLALSAADVDPGEADGGSPTEVALVSEILPGGSGVSDQDDDVNDAPVTDAKSD